jgi:hypothetical protein
VKQVYSAYLLTSSVASVAAANERQVAMVAAEVVEEEILILTQILDDYPPKLLPRGS